jgi:hypothetical protein
MSEREFRIPAGHARMWRMRAGERARIAQTEGHQVGDLIAFNAADLTEFLSPSHTRRCLNAIRLTRGASLYTNHREPILDLVEDTVGVHDFLAPACDPYRYRRDFGVEDHRSCRMNFVEALASLDLPAWRIPDPVNLFQHSPVLPDGRYLSAASPAGLGDYVTLLARMDLVAACSACPQDLAPTNAGRPTDLRVRLG